jgi:four helix bundle protein
MGDLSKIEVWNMSLELAASVYQMLKSGEITKDFSFRDQIRRAAVSIPSNIAEGLDSGFDKIGVRFFYIAKGSAAELKTQILLARKVEYLDQKQSDFILAELEIIVKKLNKLIAYRKSQYSK